MFKNLTPHSITVLDEDGNVVLELPKHDGPCPRVEVKYRKHMELNHVPVFEADYRGITNLPDPELGTIFIVSTLVRQLANRPDLASPGELVRDEAGRPIGCRGLVKSGWWK